MNYGDFNITPEEELQLRARLSLVESEMEDRLGITDENREEYYDQQLLDWADLTYLYSITREEVEMIYSFINKSLAILDTFKMFPFLFTDHKYVQGLDEKYGARWLNIQQILTALLKS